MVLNRIRFDLAQHFQAVHLRHFQIEQHDRGRSGVTLLKPAAAAQAI